MTKIKGMTDKSVYIATYSSMEKKTIPTHKDAKKTMKARIVHH